MHQRLRVAVFLIGSLLLQRAAWADVISDGVDDTLLTGVAISSFLTASTGTIVAVIKHTGAIDAGSGCGRERITGDSNNLMGLVIDDSPLGFYAHNFTGTSQCATGTYTADVFKHLVWRHSGGNLELFIDGVLAQTTASGNSSSMANQVHVGGVGDEAGDRVNMTTALVEYYTTALSDNTILALGKSRMKDLRNTAASAIWMFDAVAHGVTAEAVVFPDRSGNGRTITASDGANNTGMTGQGGAWLSYTQGVQ